MRELILISLVAAFAAGWRGLMTNNCSLRLLLQLQLLLALRHDRDDGGRRAFDSRRSGAKARYVSSTTKSYGLTEPPRRFYDSAAQTFRDGLLDRIQRGPERSPDCQQPRHSPCALIKPLRDIMTACA